MVTEKQISSNRGNAQKSTGPKTAMGKAMVSRNATRHGLLARSILLEGEETEVFQQFCSQMVFAMAPVGILETFLAERVTAAAWRLGRVITMEKRLLEYEGSSILESEVGLGALVAIGRSHLLPRAMENISTVTRYETAIERQLFRALHELQRLQAARNGAPVPVPAVVEVNVRGMPGDDV